MIKGAGMIKRHYGFSGGKIAQASNTEFAQSRVRSEVEAQEDKKAE